MFLSTPIPTIYKYFKTNDNNNKMEIIIIVNSYFKQTFTVSYIAY